MKVLFVSCITLCLTFVIHVAVCRTGILPRGAKTLLAIFLASVATTSCLAIMGVLPRPDTSIEFARALLLSLAVFLVYLSMNNAAERDSVSCLFLLALHRAGPAGLPREELFRLVDDDVVLSRLSDLVAGRWVKEGDGTFQITFAGRTFLWAIHTARRLYGLGDVGG